MLMVCYYEETEHGTGAKSETGLCVFNTKNKDILEYVTFEHHTPIPQTTVADSTPIHSEEKYSERSFDNPDYEEDDDGNPMDEDIEPTITKVFDVKIYPVSQNTLHLQQWTLGIFHALYRSVLRYKMTAQIQNIKKKEDEFQFETSVRISRAFEDEAL